MTFNSPLWLIALAPWAAVTVYLLTGRRRQEGVPFLALWVAGEKGPRPRVRVATPPVALAMLLLAMMLAVIGAAGPALGRGAGAGTELVVIIDRGATMSALQGGRTRLADLIDQVDGELSRRAPGRAVRLVAVPGAEGSAADVAGWAPLARALPRTAADTSDLLRATVVGRLGEHDGPVFVLTDRALGVDDPRVVRVAPERAVRNGGIVSLSARESSRPQVMVRVALPGAAGRATVVISSGGEGRTVEAQASPAGEARDFFVDFDRLGDVVRAELRFADDFDADNTAWVVRRGAWPRIEPRGELPAELRRMIDVYARARPGGADAPRAVVVSEPADLPADTPGVVAANPVAAMGGGRTLRVEDHPITRHTSWQWLTPENRTAGAPPPGWRPLVTAGGRVVIAARETPARQAWIGVESSQWARQPEFVVFWTNVFDWLGAGEVEFDSGPVRSLGNEWRSVESAGGGSGAEPGLWPGLFERASDGARCAVNAGEVRFPMSVADDWRPKLARALSAGAAGGGRPLAPWVMVAACAGVLGAAMSWRGRNLTAFSARRTVNIDAPSIADVPSQARRPLSTKTVETTSQRLARPR